MKKNIAVVAGGDSSEKAISVKSAKVVCEHLNKSSTYSAIMVHISKEKWEAELDGQFYPIDKNDFTFKWETETISFDAAFVAIHGTPGEDGKLQGYFELIGMPYTGSDVLNSSFTFNKWHCNAILKQLGYNCATSYLINEDYFSEEEYTKLLEQVTFPCFVKPNSSGSSFGVSKVKTADEFRAAIEEAFQYSSEVMIEAQMVGREVTCGVTTYENEVIAFPVTEIVSKGEFFDYTAKYEGNSEEITPARLSEELTARVQEKAKGVYKDLRLKGLARVDFMLQKTGVFIIEVNTVPGLTAESIVPQQAKAAGFSLQELFSANIEDCIRRKKEKKLKK